MAKMPLILLIYLVAVDLFSDVIYGRIYSLDI